MANLNLNMRQKTAQGSLLWEEGCLITSGVMHIHDPLPSPALGCYLLTKKELYETESWQGKGSLLGAWE